MKPTAENYLAQASLLRLLAVVGLVIAPHIARLPLWASLLVVTLGLWRGAAAIRQWPLPPPLLRTLLVLGAFIGIYASFGHINGQAAGVALLVVMLALKLTEMRTRRDVMVVIFLCYFLLLTQFLFSQEIWTILYLLGCAVAITALLAEANHAGQPLSPRVSLKLGAILVAQSLPLMVALFVLFPRLPGPLWGSPSETGAAQTGLSDSMSPGDIANLIQSDVVAFRVRFLGEPPPVYQRYWRGPVFWHFNGRRWDISFSGSRFGQPEAEMQGKPVRYEVTLEAHRQPWLFALDLPSAAALPANSYLNTDYQLLAGKPVTDRLLYEITSYTHYRLQPELPPKMRQPLLRLPYGYNPRARELAERWRNQGLSDEQIVDEALRMFRRENFVYTLQPPKLGRNSVDEFLFDTRRGFCEHYSSAFTVLMRAAGIPARVVSGYQGGELNALGNYYVVRQSDAHAWSEVWVASRGWVRIDPTAAVAPSRIESGISSALTEAEGLPGYLAARYGSKWRFNWEARWDWVNAQWNRWVLAYGPDLQQGFLSRFGLGDWQNMILALTAITTAMLALLGVVLMRQTRPVYPHDPALRLWQRAVHRLARAGLPQAPAEGPRDYAQRVATARPELAAAMQALAEAYLRARYLDEDNRPAQLELTAAARKIRP